MSEFQLDQGTTVYHLSRDPESVIEEGFQARYAQSGLGEMYFTLTPQQESNIQAQLSNNLVLYLGKVYGQQDTKLADLISENKYHGRYSEVGAGDKYLPKGGFEVVLFESVLNSLINIKKFKASK